MFGGGLLGGIVNRPNLFLVGPPRSATTSLAYWMNAHPDITMSRPKETGHHAVDLNMPEAISDRGEYLALFRDAGGSVLRGEATPWYLFSTAAAESIHDMSPDATIVVNLRDPVEMLSSLHHHHLYVGIETEADFRTAVLGGPRQRLGRDFRDGLDYLAVGRLGRQVARYLDFYPRSQIVCVHFDDLVDQPDETYRNLLVRLGVEPRPLAGYPHLNPARRHRSPRFERLLGPVGRAAAGNRRAAALHTRLDRLNTARGRASPDAATRAEIINALTPDMKLFSSLMGIDVSSWQRSHAV